MTRLLNKLLVGFRVGARTVGLNPKVLGAAIASVLTAALNFGLSKVGLTLQDVADWFGTSPQYVVAAQVILGSTIASILLPPGLVTQPDPVVERVMDDVDPAPPK